MSKTRNVLLGALAGGIIATTVAFLDSRQKLLYRLKGQTRDLSTKARNIKENVFDNLQDLTESRRGRTSKIFAGGAALGLLLGAGVVALLTPKNGRQLRRELSERYQDVADKTHDFIYHFNNGAKIRKPIKKLAKTLAKTRRKALGK